MSLLSSIGYKFTLAVSEMMGYGTKVASDPVFSDNAGTLKQIAQNFEKLMQNILGPVLIVLGAAAGIYLVYLGILYAKAEDANKRKEVQGRLIGAAIGLVIIVVGITLVYAINWESIYNGLSTN